MLLDTMKPITLLAMAPSGETFFARDQFDRVWLYQPLGAGEPKVVAERDVERAVTAHAFERFEREFPTWQALDDFRHEHALNLAPLVVSDDDELDLDDVERLSDVARRWISEGKGVQARKLVLRLLRLPAVRVDNTMHERLLGVLEALSEPPTIVFRSSETEPVKEAAHDRWEQLLKVA